MYRTNDPAADFRAWDREQSRMLERLPVCADCEEPIQSSHGYFIDDRWICPECLRDCYRKDIDFYE